MMDRFIHSCKERRDKNLSVDKYHDAWELKPISELSSPDSRGGETCSHNTCFAAASYGTYHTAVRLLPCFARRPRGGISLRKLQQM